MEYSGVCVVREGLRLLHCVLQTVRVEFISPLCHFEPQELWKCPVKGCRGVSDGPRSTVLSTRHLMLSCPRGSSAVCSSSLHLCFCPSADGGIPLW